MGFRPLIRGITYLSTKRKTNTDICSFRPLIRVLLIYETYPGTVSSNVWFSSPSRGCYLSMKITELNYKGGMFSSPSRGCYLSIRFISIDEFAQHIFSSPSRGCYLSIVDGKGTSRSEKQLFVPFSGVLLIYSYIPFQGINMIYLFVPFSGVLLIYTYGKNMAIMLFLFVPFSGVLLIYYDTSLSFINNTDFSSPSRGCYLSIQAFRNESEFASFFSSPSRGCYLSIQ